MARPIFPWPGGKRRLLKPLLRNLPPHDSYIEAFAGGAALILAKPEVRAEIINDLDGELIRLYRCVQHHLDELIRQFRWSLVSREMFVWLKQTRVETLTDIQRAARFYYLQRTCFGGKSNSRTFGIAAGHPPRLNLLRMEEDLSQAHLRLCRATIENLPWRECVRRYDRNGALFFFDPPYWEAVGYEVKFPAEDYLALAETIRSLRGHAVLTINDHPKMREIFAGFDCERVPINYTIGGNDAGKRADELIMRTWNREP